MESIVQSIGEFLRTYLSPELVVFLISLLPILELRGGLIAAALFGLPWWKAALISVVGNIIPVPFIIFFIERILRFLKDHGPLKKFARWIEEKGMRKGQELMEKYPTRVKLGLFLFVAIPLPGTGAWTGSLIAALMGLKPKESAPFIGLGVLGACLIMSFITYVIPWIITLI